MSLYLRAIQMLLSSSRGFYTGPAVSAAMLINAFNSTEGQDTGSIRKGARVAAGSSNTSTGRGLVSNLSDIAQGMLYQAIGSWLARQFESWDLSIFGAEDAADETDSAMDAIDSLDEQTRQSIEQLLQQLNAAIAQISVLLQVINPLLNPAGFMACVQAGSQLIDHAGNSILDLCKQRDTLMDQCFSQLVQRCEAECSKPEPEKPKAPGCTPTAEAPTTPAKAAPTCDAPAGMGTGGGGSSGGGGGGSGAPQAPPSSALPTSPAQTAPPNNSAPPSTQSTQTPPPTGSSTGPGTGPGAAQCPPLPGKPGKPGAGDKQPTEPSKVAPPPAPTPEQEPKEQPKEQPKPTPTTPASTQCPPDPDPDPDPDPAPSPTPDPGPAPETGTETDTDTDTEKCEPPVAEEAECQPEENVGSTVFQGVLGLVGFGILAVGIGCLVNFIQEQVENWWEQVQPPPPP
ncbi:hypothetical protein NQ024_10295, partial [Corynebacterium sp. 35RC1]|nr:hypothetical protein [Corynebacterium sp. 35RC1]